MHPTRSIRAWLSVCAGALAVAACGGGDNGGYATTILVADTAGAANPYGNSAHVDSNLVNAWGIAFNPQGFVWVANAGTSTSTLYDGNGVPQSLVVTIPDGLAGEAEPTGIVFNASSGFQVSQGGLTGASAFIFAGEAGTISGWSPAVNLNNAIKVVDRSGAGAIYKGLAHAIQGGADFLYATDFHNGTVDVFDSTFTKVTTAGAFADANLPAGYAPFGIQAIGNLIYVSFARQDAQAEDDVAGAGLGAVDVFDTSGVLVRRLVAVGGGLNAPWGMAMAPADFGPFSNALLVANFGDGKINAFDPATGAFLGTLSRSNGSAIAIDGLWGIAFGNGLNGQPTNTLFFTGGPGGETHGVYGRIDNR
ncbi:MAG: TIGR03118 family protein [Caldimonas sp.]